MVTVINENTQATTASEVDLDSSLLNRTFILWLDLSAMQAADQYRFRVYKKARSAGAELKCAEQTFTGVQDPVQGCLVPISSPYGIRITVQRLAGADRSVGWSLESL